MLNEEKTTNNTNNKFKTMQELADAWGCHRDTLSKYIKRLQDKIPNYVPKQKMFSPAQYKALAHELGFDI